MTDAIVLGLIAVLATVASALFSGAEIALLSADPAALKHRARPGGREAVMVERFLARPHWFLAATLLGATLSLLAAVIPVSAVLIERWPEWGAAAAFGLVAPAFIFFGRVLPKIFYHPRANRTAISALRALEPVIYIFYPLLTVVIGLGWLVDLVLGRGPGSHSFWYTRDQLKLLLTLPSSQLELGLDDEGRAMIDRVFEFSETEVEEIMIPLIEVEALEADMPVGEALRKVSQRMFSRYPVYRERIDNVVGMVEAVDLLDVDDHFAAISSWVRPVRYTPYNKPVDELLFSMQRENYNLAVVVDEFGGCVGVITREDIVEEIVGEIEDEHDQPAPQYREIAPGRYRVSARMEIYDLKDLLGWDLPEGEYETLAGFLLSIFRRVPEEGERIRYHHLFFTITCANPRAIQEVEVEVEAKAEET